MSIQALNTYGSQNVTYTDNRSPDVIFTTPGPFEDINLTITTKTFQVQKSKEIYEVINTSVSFEIDVTAIAGVTVSWPTVPVGCTVTNAGGVYTIDGITSAETWDIVKSPTIIVPDTFSGSFFYECAIRYQTSTGLTSQEWTVGLFIPVANLSGAAGLACSGNRIRFVSPQLSTTALLTHVDSLAQIFTRASLTADGISLNPFSSSIDLVASLELYSPLANLKNLTYRSNISNFIFGATTPYVDDPSPGTTYDVTLSVSSGNLSDDDGATSSSSITLTGSLATVNAQFSGIIYYPNYNQTSNVILSYTVNKDSVEIDSGKTTIVRTGTGTISTNTYTKLSSGTITFTLEEFLYGKLDILMVAGGGGGSSEGGGGGGGGVLELTNVAITNRSNSVTVGTGGARNTNQTNCANEHGGDGNDTVGFGQTVNGGQGGRNYECYSTPPTQTVWIKNGGASGAPTNYAGQTESGTVNFQYSAIVGGGGGGAGEAGGTNADGYGGDGIQSTIFPGEYYGGGGAGTNAPATPPDGVGGGLGGGGNRYYNTNGGANTGGGGGAGFGTGSFRAGAGGSGIIKVKVKPK